MKKTIAQKINTYLSGLKHPAPVDRIAARTGAKKESVQRILYYMENDNQVQREGKNSWMLAG